LGADKAIVCLSFSSTDFLAHGTPNPAAMTSTVAARAPLQAADSWARFDEEILKHCVDENHSYEETKAYMEDTFGFKARSVRRACKQTIGLIIFAYS
jgi:hypothetical protein